MLNIQDELSRMSPAILQADYITEIITRRVMKKVCIENKKGYLTFQLGSDF